MWRTSGLTRYGTAEPVSRGRERGQGKLNIPCSADCKQYRQPYPVNPYSAKSADHTLAQVEDLLISRSNLVDAIMLTFEMIHLRPTSAPSAIYNCLKHDATFYSDWFVISRLLIYPHDRLEYHESCSLRAIIERKALPIFELTFTFSRHF